MTFPIRSVAKKTAGYVTSAALISVLIIVASTLYLGAPAVTSPTAGSSSVGSSTSLSGPQSLLVIQLTDPPQVPAGTKSLNLTYSALSLVVGEPSGNGKLSPKTVNVTPTGGSATLNLLRLQNVSQTIASASLPNDTVIYSVGFTVTAISINVGGNLSSVTLATGGNSFSVTISQPTALSGENVALLQLNPIVVGTPSGYQLIPSSVGVIKHAQGEGQEQVGSQHQMSGGDNDFLRSARGNLTANLLTLTVSGNTTSVTVQVRNIGNASVDISSIGLHGNFTTTGSECSSMMFTTSTHNSQSHSTSTGSSENHRMCVVPEHMNEVVFLPVVPATSTSSTSTKSSTTTTSTSTAACTSGQMKLLGGDGDQGIGRGFTLQPGQCINFAFSGKITFGPLPLVLTPSTASGQVYYVDVIGSFGANVQLTCTLPLGATSCKTDTQHWFDTVRGFPFG